MGAHTPTGLSLPALSGDTHLHLHSAQSRLGTWTSASHPVAGKRQCSQDSGGAETVIHFPASPGKRLVTKFSDFSFKGDFRGPCNQGTA